MVSRRECANAIRMLAADAVHKAQSGHPGMPMGMADIAEVLWRDYLRFNPLNPNWLNRDRFILSNGHGAMLQYALLHLSGFDLSMDDIKQFRQLHSNTPGHPEFGETPGVETSTGPLGQGLANGVGMALAETQLARQFNRENYPIIDFHTYVFMGDGCLMEGISHEACSLAGTWKLGNLIVFWDDNGISIDGQVKGWFTDNTAARFVDYGWHVISGIDGHDPKAVSEAIEEAHFINGSPTLICCKTDIGYGSPNLAGTAAVHGAPLSDEEMVNVRKNLNWESPPFHIPPAIYEAWDQKQKGQAAEARWNDLFSRYQKDHPELAAELLRRSAKQLPQDWQGKADQFIREAQQKGGKMATRKASQHCLNAYAPLLPELIGGSADLSGSNCTQWQCSEVYSEKQRDGNYIHYGVREFAMSAIMNGIALTRAFIPFGGTFLTFSDYARNAVRLAALMSQRVIFVYSHDSIGVGEDGPTHQPIEHAAMLRMTPNLDVWRPCDAVETAIAWQQSILAEHPSCLLLTRQNVAHQQRDEKTLESVKQGGYILWEAENSACEGILIATGSEVELAVEAAKQLQAQGSYWRVVSMPCCEIFKKQPLDYRNQVLPPEITQRIAIEAGVTDYWHQFVGSNGIVIGIDHFGASAPAGQLFTEYGLTVENILMKIKHNYAPLKV